MAQGLSFIRSCPIQQTQASFGWGFRLQAYLQPKTADPRGSEGTVLSNATQAQEASHPAAPQNGEVGHCVHSIVRASGRDDLLYQQNHHVFGARPTAVGAGIIFQKGFPQPSVSRSPFTLETLQRCGRCRLMATWQGGFRLTQLQQFGGRATVEKLGAICAKGYRRRRVFFTVLRQAMTCDARNPAGIYFGTTVCLCSPVSTKGKIGRKLLGTFPLFFQSRSLTSIRAVKWMLRYTIRLTCDSRFPPDLGRVRRKVH